MSNFLKEISDVIGEKVEEVRPFSGGKILQSSQKKYFLKHQSQASPIFLKEARGLEALRATKTVDVVPVVYATEFLILLNFIESTSPQRNFFSDFGMSLAHMHRHQAPQCGFVEDNFLGATPQPNLNPKAPALA